MTIQAAVQDHGLRGARAAQSVHQLFDRTSSMESWSRCSVTVNGQDNRHQTFASFTVTSRECSGRIESILRHPDPHPGQDMRRSAAAGSQSTPVKLSRREHEVLRWMTEGKNTWEISRILHISERTVYFHVQNILGKLGAASRSHAVSIAIKEGIC